MVSGMKLLRTDCIVVLHPQHLLPGTVIGCDGPEIHRFLNLTQIVVFTGRMKLNHRLQERRTLVHGHELPQDLEHSCKLGIRAPTFGAHDG